MSFWNRVNFLRESIDTPTKTKFPEIKHPRHLRSSEDYDDKLIIYSSMAIMTSLKRRSINQWTVLIDITHTDDKTVQPRGGGNILKTFQTKTDEWML